jgi:N-acetylglucosaminyldiphosphoundecaprenol N-acetyl-beta-D-mannosaminyltransferase
MRMKRIEVLGVPVDCVTMDEAVAWVDSAMREHGPSSILAVNPEKVMRAQHNPVLLSALRTAHLVIPDGIGVVLAARLLRLGSMSRVPGSELMPAICERAAEHGRTAFLFGASPEVNEEVGRLLPERYPGMRVAGRQHGYIKEDDMPALIKAINRSQADILFVALGSPKQEYWINRYLPYLRVKICQGVGGTFDVLAGRVKRAPKLFLGLHLEWFYRLASDPRRLRRQTALPLFAYHVLKDKFVNRHVRRHVLPSNATKVSGGLPSQEETAHNREKAA